MKKNQCQPLNRPIEIEIDNNSRKDDDIDGEGSSYSSFYSSILRADSSNSTENVESDVESSPKSSSRKFSHSNDKYYFNKMRKQKSTNSKVSMQKSAAKSWWPCFLRSRGQSSVSLLCFLSGIDILSFVLQSWTLKLKKFFFCICEDRSLFIFWNWLSALYFAKSTFNDKLENSFVVD